jgi:hypothetical protein
MFVVFQKYFGWLDQLCFTNYQELVRSFVCSLLCALIMVEVSQVRSQSSLLTNVLAILTDQ